MPVIADKIKVITDGRVPDNGPGARSIWTDDEGTLYGNVDGEAVELGGSGSGSGVEIRSSAPSGTADAVWIQDSGTTPTRTVALKVRISTVVLTVGSITL